MAVAVVTDSTSCLTAGRAGQEGVSVVPLHVLVGGRGASREITPGELAEVMSHGRERVTTSTLSPGELVAAYREVARRTGCDGLVSVHLSSGVSGTVGAAGLAAQELAGELAVEVVDSRTLGMALGYAACSAARAAAGGAGVAQVAAAARARAEGSRTWFYVDTLEHLRRGGRIGRAQALVGSALSIKPLLTVRDGVVEPEARVRTRAKALARLLELAVDEAERAGGEGRLVEVAVHELAARPAAEELAGRLAEATGVQPEVVEVDPVVGAHTGPGTLGVVIAPLPAG